MRLAKGDAHLAMAKFRNQDFRPIVPFAAIGCFHDRRGTVKNIGLVAELSYRPASRFDQKDFEQFIKDGSLAMLEGDQRAGSPMAFLGLGFGPVPAEWKKDFDEDKHPRLPSKSPDGSGGEFRPV